MDERAALLRAVLENPHEDTVRLAFADWCDEHGESERAALIRGQVARKLNPAQFRKRRTTNPVGFFWELMALENHLWPSELWEGDAMRSAFAGFDFPPNDEAWFVFARGFVCEIRLPAALLLQHAESIFRAHPVTVVRLTDLHFFASSGNDTYYVGGLGRFPRKYWSALEGLPHARAGLDAASAVCVAHGRELAGLPPLTPA